MKNKHLLKLSIPMHLLLMLSFFIVDYNLWFLLGIFILWTLIGGYGVAVGYHRYFAHKSFKTYRPVEMVIAYLGLLSCDGSLPFWVALHRGIHHRYADTEKDPHSPIHGKFNAFVWWQKDISHETVNLLSARDVMRDEFVVFLHNNQYKIFWLTFLILFMISWQFALGVFVPASLLSHHQDNIVNVLGHIKTPFSYRNYETDDNSVNDVLTGLLVWGQGWHNNHHYNAGTSNFGGTHWWEFDSSHSLLIPLIRKRNE
jgi:stearoyl-CoA desaturase (delta-9 desaturase)